MFPGPTYWFHLSPILELRIVKKIIAKLISARDGMMESKVLDLYYTMGRASGHMYHGLQVCKRSYRV